MWYSLPYTSEKGVPTVHESNMTKFMYIHQQGKTQDRRWIGKEVYGAICDFKICKTQGASGGATGSTHEREKEKYASNPDIDTSRSKYNFHIVKLDPSVYYLDAVPIDLNISSLLLLNIGTLVASMLMLLGPSYLITRIDPAKSIRFE